VSRLWYWTKGFGRFWYHFLVGDDWTIAAGVVAWWLLPFGAVAVLVLSVVRENRRV
jgi:hypothetical protein